MHFSWEKHLELSRNVAVVSDENQGMALALMGIALTMLATDLLTNEMKTSALPSSLAWCPRVMPSSLLSISSEKIHLIFVVVVFLGLDPKSWKRKDEAASNQNFHSLWDLVSPPWREFQCESVSTAVVFFEFGYRSIRLIVLSDCA